MPKTKPAVLAPRYPGPARNDSRTRRKDNPPPTDLDPTRFQSRGRVSECPRAGRQRGDESDSRTDNCVGLPDRSARSPTARHCDFAPPAPGSFAARTPTWDLQWIAALELN